MSESTIPDWIDRSVYPFVHQFAGLPAGKMHYIDEGEGEVLLFVHGTPTWSFLYRNYIRQLSKQYRCIAVDLIGFGLSDKPKGFEGTPQAHSRLLAEFIDHLGLENITLVLHDFGGPIGLSYAIEHPDRVARIVSFNTWLWETASNKDAQKVDWLLHTWLGKFLYLYWNISPKVLLKQGFYDKQKLSKKVHRHYTGVFPDKNSRYGLLRIGRSLVGASDWYQEQWERLTAIEDKPWLILWGTEDGFLGTEFLERWKSRLPRASVITYECGHFVQEEKPEESLAEIRHFLAYSSAEHLTK